MYSFLRHLSLLPPFHKNIVSSVPLRDGRLLPRREHFLEKMRKSYFSHIIMLSTFLSHGQFSRPRIWILNWVFNLPGCTSHIRLELSWPRCRCRISCRSRRACRFARSTWSPSSPADEGYSRHLRQWEPDKAKSNRSFEPSKMLVGWKEKYRLM